MKGRLAAILSVTVLLSLAFWPTVRADDVRVDVAFSALPSDSEDYDELANLGNQTDRTLSNYNFTWTPFFDANPDLLGLTVAPLTTPIIIERETSTLEVVQRVLFQSDQIMSGGSVSFWRSPIGNYTNTSLVDFRLYRSDTASNNVTSIGPDGPIFEDPVQVREVYSYSGFPEDDFPAMARTFYIPLVYDASQAQWTDLSSTIEDTFVTENFPGNNYGASTELYVSQENSGFQRSRTLVKWDTSSLPSDAVILSANLTFHAFDVFANGFPVGGHEIGAFLTEGDWVEGSVTWNDKPSFGSLDSTIMTTAAPADFSWNVTEAVRRGYIGSQERGVTLKYLFEEAPNQEWTFLSSTENVTGSERPQLWVQWAPGDAGYKFAYIGVRAPIFPAKNYFAYWNFSGAGPQNYHLYFTEGNVAQDGVYKSWFREDAGSTTFVPVDLDQSVVFIRGMAHGIAGLVSECAYYDVACTSNDPKVEYNLTTSVVVGGPTSPTFLNVVMPVINKEPTQTTPDILIDATIFFQSGAGPAQVAQALFLNETTSLAQRSWNITAISAGAFVGETVIRVYFEIYPLHADEPLVFYLNANVRETWTNLSIVLDGGGGLTIPFHYALFGYFSVDPFFFENTDRDIVLVPVEEPDTALGIFEVFQSWRASLSSTGETSCAAQLESRTWSYITTLGGKAIIDLLSGDQCLIDAVLAGAAFLLRSTLNFLAPIFGPVGDWLYKVGTWIWQAIEFVINALQWFLFWAVKLINVFLVAVIFSIAYLAPSYVGRAFHEWVREGYDIEVLREVMREGWDKVWSLIHLIIVLVLLAISAISAVLPL